MCAVDLDDCITDSGYIKQPAADIGDITGNEKPKAAYNMGYAV